MSWAACKVAETSHTHRNASFEKKFQINEKKNIKTIQILPEMSVIWKIPLQEQSYTSAYIHLCTHTYIRVQEAHMCSPAQ